MHMEYATVMVTEDTHTTLACLAILQAHRQTQA